MGRDTTAGKRMAAKRSREKAAGLRRLNVAVKPEVLDRLAELMKQHSCASQAQLIEFLVMAEPAALAVVPVKKRRNEVTDKKAKSANKAQIKKQAVTHKKKSSVKMPKDKTGVGMVQNKVLPVQMSLFEN